MQAMVALVIGILLGGSTVAWATHDGALVYEQPTGAWGASYDQPSQQAANQRALQACGKYAPHCAVVVEFWNLCAAGRVPVACGYISQAHLSTVIVAKRARRKRSHGLPVALAPLVTP